MVKNSQVNPKCSPMIPRTVAPISIPKSITIDRSAEPVPRYSLGNGSMASDVMEWYIKLCPVPVINAGAIITEACVSLTRP